MFTLFNDALMIGIVVLITIIGVVLYTVLGRYFRGVTKPFSWVILFYVSLSGFVLSYIYGSLIKGAYLTSFSEIFFVSSFSFIPFVLLGLLSGRFFYSSQRAGVIAATITVLGVMTWFYGASVIYPDPQSALVVIFGPFYATLILPVGYIVGELIAILVAHFRK